MRAGVVSDIHGSYQHLQRALRAMGQIDLLIHAGDGYRDLLKLRRELDSLAVQAVAGNCDLQADCPEETIFRLDQWRIFLTHGHLYGVKSDLRRLAARGRELGVDLVIFGHTHRPERREERGLTLFNPGSLYPARAYGCLSYGVIETGGGNLRANLHYL